ncbi:hypothetical protein [Acaryochloris marina]|uniref:hypothetical protein n=1 Tax=Acaryochloris marina TaxID=155978 RepID=UPI001BAE6EF5|nr:hypothetical protein [Acaryochloris marina]QUY45735.1 hypothetical protein I1H34_28675 [Acaryochloris marina S15]
MNTTQKAKHARDVLLKRKPAPSEGTSNAKQDDPKETRTPAVSLANLAMPETKTTVPKNKLYKRLWFQLLLLTVVGTPFALLATGMLYGSAPQQAESNPQSEETGSTVAQSQEEVLTQENADLKVEIAALRQSLDGQPVSPAQNKGPKPAAVPPTPKPQGRPPSPTHRVTRPIRYQSAVPRTQPKPRIVYRDRPAPKTQPVVAARPPAPRPQPQPVAQAAPQPASNFSLSKQSAFAPKPVQPKPIRPIQVSTSHPVRKPITTKPIAQTPPAPPQGVLVASLTGDLLEDNQVVTDSPTALYPATSNPLGKGLIAAGTTAKAKLDNPITWIPQNSDAIIGQRYLLTLSEDLGAMAKKGSKVVAEVTAAEGDFLSMQVVEVNQQPIEHMDLTGESPESRKTPVAVIQYKQSPHLQAKLKGQGEGFGNKLLRAGLNVGIDQLRSSSVGDRASSVVNSLAPSRSSSGSRNGLYHFNKEVEIYFMEGV